MGGHNTSPAAGAPPPQHHAGGQHVISHIDPHAKADMKPIPIPQVLDVPTYAKDYRPDFHPPKTYLRWRQNQRSEYHVDYDLDEEDSRWVDAFNGGQQRLSKDKMELMMWKLELMNAAATERILDKNGATPTEKNSAASAAMTEHLSAHEAIGSLTVQTGLRDKVCDAIFKYWKLKRKRRGKPLMRQLEAATNPQDTNPFHVFRPREKQHRPQTRRRRENDMRSYDRLREVRENLVSACQLMDLVHARELKKWELTQHEVDEQRLRLRVHLEDPAEHETIATEMITAVKDRARRALQAEEGGGRRGLGVEDGGVERRPMYPGRGGGRRGGMRFQLTRRSPARAVADLALAPLAPDPHAPFAVDATLDLERVEKALLFTLPRGVKKEAVRPRFGRGGRLVFDRCDPMTGELYGARGDANGDAMEVDG